MSVPSATVGAPARPLSAGDPVAAVPGVGSSRARVFSRLGVATVDDLLRLAPRRYEDRRAPTPATALVPGTVATWVGRVESVRFVRARRGLSIVEAAGSDASGEARARWFNQPWLARAMVVGARVLWHGPVRAVGRRVEMASPAVERVPDDDGEEHPGVGRLVPVHPATAGLSSLAVRRAAWEALRRLSPPSDPLPARWREGEGLPPLSETFRALHFPRDEHESEAARRRLAFDELVVHELLLAKRRAAREREAGIPFRFTPTLDRRIRARFPFALTPGQERAVAEIRQDLARPVPMNRLLQGDVGSGKTLVAAYACLACVANRRQAAFMAPTEVLARQHARTLSALLAGSDVRIATLLGSSRGKARKEALARIAAGDADLVVATHAVLSGPVRFRDLALVVVDEQHKFGVGQRRTLVEKGPSPHCLVMTATPIPRTLAMVAYGDLDLTVLEGMPPGRGRRETVVATAADARAVFARVEEALARGEQAFVVYPLVEESDRVGLRDATAGARAWRAALPARRVGLVHGRMDADERDAAMEAFRRRDVDLLVATVVVEVGVDVPNATVLVVEHAERFGLSQLHQLRGRVGRGKAGGLCVLLDRGGAGDGSTERLRVLARTEDGFEIAEEDLRRRGAGDLLGTRQHGAPGFHAARLPDDLPVLERARRVARETLVADPALSAPDLAPLRERVAQRERLAAIAAAGG
jgi:ATP-dependent DNA helicase RecG